MRYGIRLDLSLEQTHLFYSKENDVFRQQNSYLKYKFEQSIFCA
jgi:hypothetical protein